jgi:cytidine deaminase
VTELGALLGAAMQDGNVIPAEAVDGLMRQSGLAVVESVMLALLPHAQALARPEISAFRVGAVGRVRQTGALILGANVEFHGATAPETIHAEQFLFSRAYHRGATLDLIAVSDRPCGHCRQFMTEFEGREVLTILDPGGDRLRLAEMLPWNFSPVDLGEVGASPLSGRPRLVDREQSGSLEPPVLAALTAAGGRAYTPYSGAAAAIALRLADGVIVTGSAIENAVYNPGLAPLQAALINLIAAGRAYSDIAEAVLGAEPNAAFDHSGSARRLLGLIAPHARFGTVTWQAAPSS